MNKNIKNLARAKANKFGGEDSIGYRRGRGAKPYRKERISQTETSDMGTYEVHDGGDTSSFEPGTYNADNKAISAAMGRHIGEYKKELQGMGYSPSESGKIAVSHENGLRDIVVRGSKQNDSKELDRAWSAFNRRDKIFAKADKARDKRMSRSSVRGGISPGPGESWWAWERRLGK